MFCPRCGRPVGDTANFCGGCGLPKAEILTYTAAVQQQNTVAVASPAAEIPAVDTEDINNTVLQLENEINNINPDTDYTTETTADTTEEVVTPSDYVQRQIEEEKQAATDTGAYFYTEKAPEYPQIPYTTAETGYTATDYPQAVPTQTDTKEEPLSTVDFIWMMLISSVPLVGFFYLIWLAFIQKDSVTKASFARAIIIVTIFSFLLVFVFMMGLIATQIAMFY